VRGFEFKSAACQIILCISGGKQTSVVARTRKEIIRSKPIAGGKSEIFVVESFTRPRYLRSNRLLLLLLLLVVVVVGHRHYHHTHTHTHTHTYIYMYMFVIGILFKRIARNNVKCQLDATR